MRQLRDVDTGEVAQKLRTLIFSSIGGGIGLMLGSAAGTRLGAPLAGAFIGFVVGWLGMYLIVFGTASRIGTAASGIYMSSGSSTPPVRQYSLAQSYAVRGQFEEAAAEYERCANEYPDDPEPALRLGRLYRDELQRHEDAVRWFKRACAIPNLPAPTDIMATRELIEIYTHRMKQPAAAAPLLARLAGRHPQTPAAEWATRELALLRAELHGAKPAGTDPAE
jgi:tetratricopeptide (TPR) repeat protein